MYQDESGYQFSQLPSGVHLQNRVSSTPNHNMFQINRKKKVYFIKINFVTKERTAAADKTECSVRGPQPQKKKKNLHGLSTRANYTDRATAACR
jgi:hypothetical protein